MDAGAPEQTPDRSRHRRTIRWFLVLGIGLVVSTLVGAGIVVTTYEPLEEGSVSGTPVSPGYRDVDDPIRPTRIVTYQHGAALEVLFAIRNSGPWGVTILDIPGRDFGLWRVTEVRRGLLGRCCVATEPFRPFALHPDEERLILLRGVLVNCSRSSPGGGVGWDGYEVRYRFLGMTRTMRVPTREELSIEISEGYVCPAS